MTLNRRIIAILSSGSLAILVGLGGIAPSFGQTPPRPPVRRIQRVRRAKANERHPELNHALRALTNAQRFLSQAAHDFQGHRARALELTQQAIAEVHQAMRVDHK